ncbi:MAG: hypothetical protein O8C61_10115 [Candidatus Methanoperedens sp.]|nr:hypothetical protein [Candidatus Methanoperedens sp.]
MTEAMVVEDIPLSIEPILDIFRAMNFIVHIAKPIDVPSFVKTMKKYRKE